MYEGWNFNSGKYLFTTDKKIDTCFEVLLSFNVVSIVYNRTINTTGAAKGILRLPHRWQRVVHNAGDYTEGQ